MQIAAACDQWRQVAEDHEVQPSASSSGAPQLPFWLLAKPVEGDWQAVPLTAFADVGSLCTILALLHLSYQSLSEVSAGQVFDNKQAVTAFAAACFHLMIVLADHENCINNRCGCSADVCMHAGSSGCSAV